jgi:hypothetical protein
LVFIGITAWVAVGLVDSERADAASRAPQVRQPDVIGQITYYQRATWRWQRVMQTSLTPTTHSARTDPSLRYQRWVRDLWKARAARARRRALNPPHRSAWLCLQRYEAPWSDPNAPYYGGLQMDWRFMAMYGRRLLRTKGPANNWTPLEQMWVAERAFRAGRGFYPWPNTARICALV